MNEKGYDRCDKVTFTFGDYTVEFQNAGKEMQSGKSAWYINLWVNETVLVRNFGLSWTRMVSTTFARECLNIFLKDNDEGEDDE